MTLNSIIVLCCEHAQPQLLKFYKTIICYVDKRSVVCLVIAFINFFRYFNAAF